GEPEPARRHHLAVPAGDAAARDHQRHRDAERAPRALAVPGDDADHRRHRARHRRGWLAASDDARQAIALVRHEVPVLVVADELARWLVLELEEFFGIAARRHAQEAGEIVLQAARG